VIAKGIVRGVTRGTFSGTHQGEIMGILAKQITFRSFMIIVVDSKLWNIKGQAGHNVLNAAVGVLPLPQ